MQSRTSSDRMKTLYPSLHFQNFIEDVQLKRNKIFMELLKERDDKKSISRSYLRKKKILPENLKNRDQAPITSIHRSINKKKTEVQEDLSTKENLEKNSQPECQPTNRKIRTKILKNSNSKEKWNLLMTPEEKNSVFFGNQRALGDQIRAKYLNQQKLDKLKKDMMNRLRNRPFFISMYQKRAPCISQK